MRTYPISTEESDLVKKCLNGNPQAPGLLYKKYVKAVYSNIIRIVVDNNDAEDCLQETFIKVFSKLHTYKGESTLGAWIKRIAINVSLNHLRSKKNLFAPSSEDRVFVDPASPNETETTQLNVKRIHEEIKKLPNGCRVVFSLFMLEGYQHKEIAEILKISESTSKSQYQRARKLLQERLSVADCID